MVDNLKFMRKVKIYGLFHPITDELRYIGKTVKSLNQRLSNHIYNAKVTQHNKHLSNWILKILYEGNKPIIKCLEECDEQVWKEREQFWISTNNNLINLTKGGDGSLGFLHNLEVIEKIRQSKIGFKHSEKFKQEKSEFFKSIERTKQWKSNISKSKKGKKASEETKNKLSESHKGYKMPEEQKEKIRQSLLGRKRPQEVKDKISESHKNRLKI